MHLEIPQRTLFLVEKVFCDLAGFPVFLRHDRSTSFLNDVIKGVNETFKITPLVESAWWPHWPPKASQITTIARIQTALTWGREKHACAFLSLDAETAKAYIRKVPWG